MKPNMYPLNKKENIVVQELDGEVLIYNLGENKAFCLNKTSALVWDLCDGKSSISEISKKLETKLNAAVNEELVWLALDQLKKENLLANNEVVAPIFNGMSRREVIRKVGLGTMVALPVISGLTAPRAINAASGAPVTNAECNSNAAQNIGRPCTNTVGGPPNGQVCTAGAAGGGGAACAGTPTAPAATVTNAECNSNAAQNVGRQCSATSGGPSNGQVCTAGAAGGGGAACATPGGTTAPAATVTNAECNSNAAQNIGRQCSATSGGAPNGLTCRAGAAGGGGAACAA